MDCVFCGIIEGRIPSTKVYENEYCLAFKDLNPMAPTHILVVPKEHIQSLDEVNDGNIAVVAQVIKAVPEIASAAGLTGGYRVITNVGEDGGQTVKHLHFHILGGEKLSEKLN